MFPCTGLLEYRHILGCITTHRNGKKHAVSDNARQQRANAKERAQRPQVELLFEGDRFSPRYVEAPITPDVRGAISNLAAVGRVRSSSLSREQ